jgi:hypothetical protein
MDRPQWFPQLPIGPPQQPTCKAKLKTPNMPITNDFIVSPLEFNVVRNLYRTLQPLQPANLAKIDVFDVSNKRNKRVVLNLG